MLSGTPQPYSFSNHTHIASNGIECSKDQLSIKHTATGKFRCAQTAETLVSENEDRMSVFFET